jgi:cation diffusion facilitator family transporter
VDQLQRKRRISAAPLRLHILNAVMFVAEVAVGLLGNSSGLIADGLDMLGDALAFAIALAAISRGPAFKTSAARVSGTILLLLGIGVLLDAVRRWFMGGVPDGPTMVVVSTIALAVNATVLKLLSKHRDAGAHLRATWIFTRADVVANIAVILSGLAVLVTGVRSVDLIVGGAIGVYVIKEAIEIFVDARPARTESRS